MTPPRPGGSIIRNRLAVLISAGALAAAGALATITTEPALASSPVPQAAAASSVHFTAAGDYGMLTNATAVMNTIGSIDHDMHISVGDLSYGATGEEQAWCDFVTSRVGAGFPFELLSGNHESGGLNGRINDFAACLPNQIPGVIGTYRQYSTSTPAVDPLVRFILISPDLNSLAGSGNYTGRLLRAISGPPPRSTAPARRVSPGSSSPCTSLLTSSPWELEIRSGPHQPADHQEGRPGPYRARAPLQRTNQLGYLRRHAN